MGSLSNIIGNHGHNQFGGVNVNSNVHNTYRDEDGIKGLYFSIDEEEASLNYGSMAFS